MLLAEAEEERADVDKELDKVLGDLVDWIAQRLEEGVPATTITQMLLA